MDVLKQANDYGVQLYEEHQRFVKSFDARWRSDENVMLLLSAIALFTPERSNVLHKDVVKLEQVFIIRFYLLRLIPPFLIKIRTAELFFRIHHH